MFSDDPILHHTFITSPPVLVPVVSINHNQQTMTSSQNSLPPGSRSWIFIRDLVFLVILAVALHVVFYVETHPGLSGSLWLVKVFSPEDSTDSPIFDVGFLITTPLYKILAASNFYNDVFAGLNSLFIFMALPYVLKVTFWQADYTLAFRIIATQLFRAFCGFFTFLPPSREFLPSYWDYPEVRRKRREHYIYFSSPFANPPWHRQSTASQARWIAQLRPIGTTPYRSSRSSPDTLQ